MPNSSFLSDSDSDSNSNSEYAAAVKEILSQTKDLCVLEQVSAINCASFSGDSVLASDLESRFAQLKSFPSSSSSAADSLGPPRQPQTQLDPRISEPGQLETFRIGKRNSFPSAACLHLGRRSLYLDLPGDKQEENDGKVSLSSFQICGKDVPRGYWMFCRGSRKDTRGFRQKISSAFVQCNSLHILQALFRLGLVYEDGDSVGTSLNK